MGQVDRIKWNLGSEEAIAKFMILTRNCDRYNSLEEALDAYNEITGRRLCFNQQRFSGATEFVEWLFKPVDKSFKSKTRKEKNEILQGMLERHECISDPDMLDYLNEMMDFNEARPSSI